MEGIAVGLLETDRVTQKAVRVVFLAKANL